MGHCRFDRLSIAPYNQRLFFDRNSGNPVGMLSTFFRKPHRSSARQLRVTDLYAKQAADVITSRVAEQRLRESEQYLRLALEAGAYVHLGMGFCERPPQGRCRSPGLL
jgi:hypothetical protein